MCEISFFVEDFYFGLYGFVKLFEIFQESFVQYFEMFFDCFIENGNVVNICCQVFSKYCYIFKCIGSVEVVSEFFYFKYVLVIYGIKLLFMYFNFLKFFDKFVSFYLYFFYELCGNNLNFFGNMFGNIIDFFFMYYY